ncbi:hypothetical protein [Amycolatopsis sp. NBC_00438]|uniref:hypothetical protein n=1 Tax=Amycolatopsis sp. NBC_00438 TaxID=2903558 RepID=UPI002E2509CF
MCWGTQHGWKGAVSLAKNPDPTVRHEFRTNVDEAWQAAVVGKRNANQRPSQRISYPKKIAGIDSAIADLVEWLTQDLAASETAPAERPPAIGSEHLSQSEAPRPHQTLPDNPTDDIAPSARSSIDGIPGTQAAPDTTPPKGGLSTGGPVVTRVEELGDILAAHVLSDIERAWGGPVPKEVKVALADHFWCDLFAHLAHVLAEGAKAFDKVPDKVTALIIKSRKASERAPLTDFVIKTAVNSIWKYVQGLSLFGWIIQVRKFLPVIRILAVLICKAPERHKAVVEYCLDPLKEQLASETKKRLVKVLREWLPEITAELARRNDLPPD